MELRLLVCFLPHLHAYALFRHEEKQRLSRKNNLVKKATLLLGGFSILLPHFIKKLILTTLNPRVDLAFKKIFDAEENTQL